MLYFEEKRESGVRKELTTVPADTVQKGIPNATRSPFELKWRSFILATSFVFLLLMLNKINSFFYIIHIS